MSRRRGGFDQRGRRGIPETLRGLGEVGGAIGGGLRGLQQLFRGRGRGLWLIVLVILVAIWAATGIYTVGPGERGVIRQFGAEVAQTGPGLNWHIPWPIQTRDVVNMAEVRRSEIGFRTVHPGPPPVTQNIPAESLMLTGDENIVDAQVLVQYVIKEPSDFLFNVKDPEIALRSATEVALRSAVGQNTIDFTMLEGRATVESLVKDFLQLLLDNYGAGIQITQVKLLVVSPPEEVKDAFDEVVRAREDRERLVRDAEGYAADIVPKARGEAEQVIRAAEAYKEERIIKAEGDADKFLQVLAEYQKAKGVTRERLYLEMIEIVLAGTEKYVIDLQASSNLLQFLPLTGSTGIE